MNERARKKFFKREQKEPAASELAAGIMKGDKTILSRGITLIESNAQRHQEKAQEMLKLLLPHSGHAVRIGITGVPGAGKSTFIEAFGSMLCGRGFKTAVLAVDPSSTVNGGSILGDKTRMESLSRHPDAFIRPSPSGGTLGGVHRKTRESMIACEAAGYDIILVETVGVGQSEVMVRSMVDFFMLLAITGAGDELQGMKKGIMELADAIIVNKADGDNRPKAIKTMREYRQILHFLQPATPGWETKTLACSALTGDGIQEIWEMIEAFVNDTKASGIFDRRRSRQVKEWMLSMIKEKLEASFFQAEEVKRLMPEMERQATAGELTVPAAVDRLFQAFWEK